MRLDNPSQNSCESGPCRETPSTVEGTIFIRRSILSDFRAWLFHRKSLRFHRFGSERTYRASYDCRRLMEVPEDKQFSRKLTAHVKAAG